MFAQANHAGARSRGGSERSLIAKISGHVENSRAFNRYRNIDEEMAKETIMKLE